MGVVEVEWGLSMGRGWGAAPGTLDGLPHHILAPPGWGGSRGVPLGPVSHKPRPREGARRGGAGARRVGSPS